MAASLSDNNVLGTATPFLARVQSALLAACVAIFSEGLAVANHRDRVAFIHQILASPTNVANAASEFALAVATDTTVIGQATQAGTVVLTGSNIAAQQALVTDASITNAVSAMFNAFCPQILA